MLLTAAEDVVLELGAAHLTLDAVAQRAGVSKGGLLYHFPSKEALLTGMIARLIEYIEAARAAAMSDSAALPENVLRAHIGVCLALDDRMRRIGAALLAAVANCPSIMDPIRERITENMRTLIDHPREPARAAILFLAAEGMGKLDLLGLNPFTPGQRQAIMDEMLRQARELG